MDIKNQIVLPSTKSLLEDISHASEHPPRQRLKSLCKTPHAGIFLSKNYAHMVAVMATAIVVASSVRPLPLHSVSSTPPPAIAHVVSPPDNAPSGPWSAHVPDGVNLGTFVDAASGLADLAKSPDAQARDPLLSRPTVTFPVPVSGSSPQRA